MSDTTNAAPEQQTEAAVTEQAQQPEVKTFTEDQVNELINGLKTKNEEFKSEKLKLREELEEIKRQQEEQNRSKLEKNQEFQSLYKLEQENAQKALQEAEKERAEKAALIEQINEGKIQSEVGALATSLAKTDTRKAAMLAKEARKFATLTEEGVKYEIGGIEVSKEKVIDMLKTEFDFLVDGNQSNGGGAAGSRGGSAASTIKGADAKAKGDLNGFIKANIKV